MKTSAQSLLPTASAKLGRLGRRHSPSQLTSELQENLLIPCGHGSSTLVHLGDQVDVGEVDLFHGALLGQASLSATEGFRFAAPGKQEMESGYQGAQLGPAWSVSLPHPQSFTFPGLVKRQIFPQTWGWMREGRARVSLAR